MKQLRVLFVAMAALLVLPAQAEWFNRVEDGIMGTRIVVELWAEDAVSATKAIDAVIDEMERIDREMSTYKTTSEISRVNADAGKKPMCISAELFGLLKTSLE